jgi:predicted RNA-binding Zn ribbon-like protein
MAVAWTKHRFSGGVLALDTANTVVLRGDPARSFDRFDDAAEIARFAEAAQGFRAEELAGRPLAAPRPDRIAGTVIAIREATDRLFRAAVHSGSVMEIGLLSDFLRACAAGLDGHSGPVGSDGPIAFEAALAVSALSLLSGDTIRRIKICTHCGWLFVDRSRNSSRLWCDMAVCGNRQKAKRHYHSRKAAYKEVADA